MSSFRIEMDRRDGTKFERRAEDQSSLDVARFWLRLMAQLPAVNLGGREFISGRIVNDRGVTVEWWQSGIE